MKLIKYPKWKEDVECKCCGSIYQISSKDIATGKICLVNFPIDCHSVFSHCPFCKEQNKTLIQKYFKECNEK